ncbi:ankyrin repeat domain-containing protein [Aspergillus melleus]|uniref:ankyrin repeat domain-containing protein n=1 Tax=Aspergillus melleus TaxID=138277 RepID=UPI001E8DECD1|nr:uncharacterized protein LDX57_010786 [Aspergillus melleus]KAH8433152.1 hypothetical protein LDX57_010786 [Aspergillus melleus]
MHKVSDELLVLDEFTGIFEPIGNRSLRYLAQKLPDAMANTQTDLARACIAYMKYGIFERGMAQSDGEFETRLLTNSFHEYASCYWGHHAREAGLKAQTATQIMSDIQPNWEYRTLKEEIIRFLGGGPCFLAALQTLNSSGPYYAKGLVLKNARLDKDRPVFPEYSQRSPEGITGMHVAAWFGLADIIPGLVEAGLHPDAESYCGRTPLSVAASQGHKKAVSLLVTRYRADPKSKDDRGFTPLQYAACKGYTRVVQYLIGIGADINSYSDLGVSALSCAAMHAHEEVVRVLCDRGANVNSADSLCYQTPLIFAVISRDEFVVRMILQKGALVDVEDESGRTALGCAAAQGSETIAKILYQAIVGDPNVLSRHNSLYGRKPLSEAGRVLMAGIVGQHRR